MVRRSIAVVLALVVIGAPLALEVCRIACAGSVTLATVAVEQQAGACRHETTSDDATMSPRAHSCSHSGDRHEPQSLDVTPAPSAPTVIGADISSATFGDPFLITSGSAPPTAGILRRADPPLMLPLRV